MREFLARRFEQEGGEVREKRGPRDFEQDTHSVWFRTPEETVRAAFRTGVSLGEDMVSIEEYGTTRQEMARATKMREAIGDIENVRLELREGLIILA